MFSYYEARIYRKLLPLKINISSRNYGQVRQSTSKILFMFGGGKIKQYRQFLYGFDLDLILLHTHILKERAPQKLFLFSMRI